MSFYLAKISSYIRTPEIREKCHKTHLKNHNGLGLKRSDETKKRISEAKKLYWSNMTIEQKRERLSKWITKKGHIPWNKGNRSQTYSNAELCRNSLKYSEFRKKMFERDCFTCAISGIKGGNLIIHHINSFSDYPDLRFLPDNVITMNKKIHDEFHSIYGRHHNDSNQFIDFLKEKNGVLAS